MGWKQVNANLYTHEAGYTAEVSGSNLILRDSDNGRRRVLGLAEIAEVAQLAGTPLPLTGLPVGAPFLWFDDALPPDAVEANGAAVSRTTYADLFAIYGTKYGPGDGATTFNLPDARGEFLRIWDHGAGRDPDAAGRTDRGDGTTGDAVGTKQGHVFAQHSHGVTVIVTPAYVFFNNPYTLFGPGGGHAWEGGNETRPRNINVMLCIKI